MNISPRLEVVPTGPLTGAVAPPASKSVTNRLLLLAALADGTSVLHNPLRSDDSAAMRDVVEGLGAAVWDVDEVGHSWRVVGTGGRISPVADVLDCRLSGTTIRFGSAVGALADGEVTFTGAAPLRRRPIGPLTTALRDLGATVHDAGGYPPLAVGGGLDGGAVTIDVSGSSQYASAVLLAAPYARADVHLGMTGIHAGAFVDLTVAAMQAWGAEVASAGPNGWTVTAGTGYQASEVTVEYDASAAAHLMALAVSTGGHVTVTGVSDTMQPDAAMTDVFAAFGATIAAEGNRLTVTGPDRPVSPGSVDLSQMPDQVTTVAALAALAEGPTTIVGAEVARGHETDRLAALAAELGKIGVMVQERPDGLVVDGSQTTGGATLDTYDDHRLAMAFASIGSRLPGVVIDQPGCVAKTFPDFWKELVRLGGEVRRA